MKTRARVFVAVVAAFALLGRPAAGQDSRPGWIGVSFELRSNPQSEAVQVVVTDVNRGSPAEAAGLRAGDLLLAINELAGPADLARLSDRLHIAAGDLVSVRLQREGRTLEVKMRAAERPADFFPGQRLQVTFETDSMVETMVRAMDSLRVRLVRGTEEVHVVAQAPRVTEPRVVVRSGGQAVRAPFEFFVFSGEDQDSLRTEMEMLNRVLPDLRARIVTRREELLRVGGQASVNQDRELRRLEAEAEEAMRRSTGLRSAMSEAAWTTAGSEYGVLAPGTPRLVTSPAVPREEYRPLTPYLLGRNRVAGAEVSDLRPELAKYFNVASGVLVLDVLRGTPAAVAGILPGDVITGIGRVAVGSVDDLRFGVAQAGGETLPISLMRQGANLQVLLRRQ